MKPRISNAFILIFLIGIIVFSFVKYSGANATKDETSNIPVEGMETVILGGGCFWCVEHDLRSATGTLDVVSGYSGGEGVKPTYEDYAQRGFREVVEVTYDPSKTSFEKLAFWMLYHADPTDGTGSFHDRGLQYAPAIYYANDEEKKIALALIKKIDDAHIYEQKLQVAVLPRVPFYRAEDYHQNYAEKNPVRYGFYRQGSGRDAFIARYREKLDAFAKTLK